MLRSHDTWLSRARLWLMHTDACTDGRIDGLRLGVDIEAHTKFCLFGFTSNVKKNAWTRKYHWQ